MAKDMTLEDYEKLANKGTGLVAMRFTRNTDVDLVGDVKGFTPETAMRLHDEDFAVPNGSKAKPAAPGSPPPPQKSSEDLRRDAIEISEGWDKWHHLNRLRLAKEISGTNVSKVEEADEIIRQELKRREGGE